MPDLAAAIKNAEEWLRVNDSIPYTHGEHEGEHVAILRTLLAAAREAEAALAEEREKLDTAHSANAELALRVGALEDALAEVGR